jgi:tol-pal system protein YbgF
MDVIRGAAIVVLSTGVSGCFAFLTKEDGKVMQDDIAALKSKSVQFDQQAAHLRKATDEADNELKKLRSLLDEATKVVTRNSANLGQDVDKLKVDLATLTGRADTIEATLATLSKSFTDFRAGADTKLEQLTNASAQAKNPPVPETPDGVFSEAKKRFDNKEWKDARRLLTAFLNRYPADVRAASAQYLIGDAYFNEGIFANAIGAFVKVIEGYPKSESVPDAMYKNGIAFYQLKYCGDARVYFQELLKRYPKTSWKPEAQEQLKKLQRDMKNKSACQS